MNLPQEYTQLTEKLIALSNDDKVRWKIGDQQDEFTLKHGNTIISLYPFDNPDEEKSYYCFSFKSVKIEDALNVSDWDFGYSLLNELYNAASRNAQNIRGAIDDFLSEFE